MDDPLNDVFKALADPTRRQLLDLLRVEPQTTSQLTKEFPDLSRFAVMKHLDILRQADLVNTRPEGRFRIHTINVVPLRMMFERWVTPFQELWSHQLTDLKRRIEGESG